MADLEPPVAEAGGGNQGHTKPNANPHANGYALV